MTHINSVQELADHMGCDHQRISKMLLKYTRCGIVFNIIENGISVCGYAEGADAECVPRELTFPFACDVFWNAVEQADAEGVEMWEEWNDEEMP